MNSELYDCTCRQLATQNPEVLDGRKTVEHGVDWFTEKGFDYAPVVYRDEPIGFTSIDALQDMRKDKELRHACDPIGLDDTISADANFREMLEGLEDQFYYFIGGQNRVTGILTRADLNTSPARMHLFDRISVLETNLRALVDEHASDWFDEMYLKQDIKEQIEKRYERAQDANIELSIIHYAGFGILTGVISEYEDCWEACGYESSHQASASLDKIQDVRNDVAHSNLILQTTADEQGSDARSIRDLRKAYDTMMSTVRTLEQG